MGAVMAQRVEVVLTGEEREVLERWARRPSSAQALALRCRIVLAAAEGRVSKEIAAPSLVVAPTRWAGGVAGSRAAGLMGCTMSLVRASRARSATRTWSG